MSGASNLHIFTFVGKAAEVTVQLPFTPKLVTFAVASGGAIEHGVKTSDMATDAYLSTTTGIDAGVTIGDHKLTIANGADINVNTATVHGQAWS